MQRRRLVVMVRLLNVAGHPPGFHAFAQKFDTSCHIWLEDDYRGFMLSIVTGGQGSVEV